MQTLEIQGYSYEDRQTLLPALLEAVTESGGWVLDRRSLSETTLEFRVELELRSIVEMYAAVIGAGLELTRSGHIALTELCQFKRHRLMAELENIVTMRLEISFLEELTVQSLLMGGSSLA